MKQNNSNEGSNLKFLDIQDIGIEFVITMLGILLLFITFSFSVTLRTPENLNDLVKFFETQRILLIFNYLGLLITFLGIALMIYSFFTAWKDAINKIYEKLK